MTPGSQRAPPRFDLACSIGSLLGSQGGLRLDKVDLVALRDGWLLISANDEAAHFLHPYP